MNKFTLEKEVTLEDNRYCDGCPELCYDRCLYLDVLLNLESDFSDECDYIRPQECPLKPVITQPPQEIPGIEFIEEGVQTC